LTSVSGAAAMAPPRTLAPFGRRATEITARETYGPYVVLGSRDPAGPRPQPGQFYMLAAAERWGGGDGERPFLPRAFSVLRASGEPGAVELLFLIEDVGPGTRRLCELKLGDGLQLVGPLGKGFKPPREDRRPILVGGGVGIAPLAIWQDELEPRVEALLGFRDGGRAKGAAVLKNVRVATDDGSVGHHGPVTDLLLEVLSCTEPSFEVFACGPPGMLEAVRLLCAEREVPAQLALESGMACGFGACFGCVVPTRKGYLRLCLDGPVLDSELLDTALVPGAGH
jgi:dihydroorotate dehydrogenase electron transfer subunit